MSIKEMMDDSYEILLTILFLLILFVSASAIFRNIPNLDKKIIPAWEVSERLIALEAKVASISLYIKAETEIENVLK